MRVVGADQSASPHSAHRGNPVRVGPYTVLAGGTSYLQPEDLSQADILVPLTDRIPVGEFGSFYEILAAPMRDFGGVPPGWETFLKEEVVPLLVGGEKILAFCVGGHGRTGTFLASLIALIETSEETPDPIEAVRARHCRQAVETRAQAEAIFALRGEPLPEKYQREFAPRQAPTPTSGKLVWGQAVTSLPGS